MTTHRQIAAAVLCFAALLGRAARSDPYDPPAGYYASAIGAGATLKGQLNNIIDSVNDNVDGPGINDTLHTPISYDALRTALQVSDAHPTDSALLIVVYNNRVPITKPTGGSIPGWDNGVTWNREHSWPQARGVDATSAPDGSDMHHVLPSIPSDNTTRGDLNFGGAYGQQGRGTVNDDGIKYYPGNLDAGLIARAQFYMDVRYDVVSSSTEDLELATGNPSSGGDTLGDLNRLIEWHFAAPPDTFELRRNDVIFDNYQDNRNPFVDRPEFAWSVFVDQANDSRITINGTTPDANGGSTRNVNLGRVFTGSTVPAAQIFTLNKTGTDGTYFDVSASGNATSTIAGRYNAFRTNQTDSKSISVGLNTNTIASGLRSGAVTVNNLDLTTSGGAGRGGNDANDVFNVSLTVVDHATPSFSSESTVASLPVNFGVVTTASAAQSIPFTVFNWGTNPSFTANMDFDSLLSSGDTTALSTDAGAWAGSLVLAGGASQIFSAFLNTTAAGTFAATYTLRFSDENIAGAQNNKDLTLSLNGTIVLAGDFNRDGIVDAADYIVWSKTNESSALAYSGADADGSGFVDAADLGWWRQNFGMTAGPGSGGSHQVPEPAGAVLAVIGLTAVCRFARSRRS